MRLGFYLKNVTTLGPGNRLAVWFAGCPRRCKGCVAPELWNSSPKQETDLIGLLRDEDLNGMTGLTVSGGEPFMQAVALYELVTFAKERGLNDILVYSGYTLKALTDMNDPAVDGVLHNITALADGEYIEELDAGERLKGSTNQVFHIFDESRTAEYAEYCKQGRQVQTFLENGAYYVVGLTPKGQRR